MAATTNSSSSSKGGLNDAQKLIKTLEGEGAFVRFKLDDDSRLVSMAWAHEVQRENAVRYHSVIVQDNTHGTNV